MPRGGPRGNKKSHKGQRRHFTDADELKVQEEKKEREKEWRRRQGMNSDEEEVQPGDLPPQKDSSSEEESSDDEEVAKPKGVSHLIEIENPNRVGGKQTKKVTELGDGATQLSRREREELEKQQAKVRYQQLHVQGKTEEARADLARLAIIRKQREEAAKKREEEKVLADGKKKEKS